MVNNKLLEIQRYCNGQITVSLRFTFEFASRSQSDKNVEKLRGFKQIVT